MRVLPNARSVLRTAASLLVLLAVGIHPVNAQHGHRGGGAARASAHSSINRPAERPHGGDHRDINRNVNRNTNRNVNVNRNVDVHVDNHDHYDHWDRYDDHPFATAAAVTAGVAVTSAVIGSIVNSVPPSCVTTVINGMAYQQCGNTWYEPRYSGTTVQYVVINPPR